jgi:hypothetical protein
MITSINHEHCYEGKTNVTEKSLQIVEQREVDFYGDELTAVRAADANIYVGLRQMCQSLGVDTQGQRQRINRNTVLSEGLMVCKLHTIQGERDTHMLRVDLVPLWLSGIRTSAVNEEVRPKLERFQREAAKVLWEAFQEGRLTADLDFDELLAAASSDALQAYQMAQAVVKLARNHLLLEARISQKFVQYDQRLEALETTLGNPGHYVTPDQASQISQAVKAVALALGKQTKRNEFGAVYGELYRKFGITSYKMLPARRFEEAMQFLTKWHEDASSELPF